MVLGTPVNFRTISFLIRAFLLWEKVTTVKNGKNMGRKKKRLVIIVATMSLPAVVPKIMSFIVANNFIASQPPEYQLEHWLIVPKMFLILFWTILNHLWNIFTHFWTRLLNLDKFWEFSMINDTFVKSILIVLTNWYHVEPY